jgi:methyl-accepting chemotaxis protein
MFNSQKNKQKSGTLIILPVAAIVALVGGIGAAVLTHPKSKKVRDDLGDVADDFIDSLERIIDKIDTNVQKGASAGFGEVSQLVMSAYEEIKSMHEAAVDEPKGVAKVVSHVKHEVVRVEESVAEKVHEVETVAHHVEDDISEKIAWLQRKGRNLARKSTSR